MHSACCPPRNDNLGGEGRVSPYFFWLNLIFLLLKGMQKFKIVAKPLLGKKGSGRKEGKIKRIMPSLVATMSAVRAHTLRLDQLEIENLKTSPTPSKCVSVESLITPF